MKNSTNEIYKKIHILKMFFKGAQGNEKVSQTECKLILLKKL